MSVKEQAYLECRAWLDDDQRGLRPEPPEGMHALSLEMWWDGFNTAVAHHQVEEAQLDQWVGFVTWVVCRIVPAVVVLGFAWWSGNGWIKMLASIVAAYIMWRKR